MEKTGQDMPEVLASEGGYRVATITSREGLEEAYRLRYKVFSEKLGWAGRRKDLLESDSYDQWAVSFGVYDEQGALKAYLRLLTSEYRFMLEDVFAPLLGSDPIVRKKPDTAEVSRLCMEPCEPRTMDERGHTPDLILLLVKGLRRWCDEHDIRFLYAELDAKAFRLYHDVKKLPLRLMGEPKTMPDGLETRVAVLDWEEYR